MLRSTEVLLVTAALAQWCQMAEKEVISSGCNAISVLYTVTNHSITATDWQIWDMASLQQQWTIKFMSSPPAKCWRSQEYEPRRAKFDSDTYSAKLQLFLISCSISWACWTNQSKIFFPFEKRFKLGNYKFGSHWAARLLFPVLLIARTTQAVTGHGQEQEAHSHWVKKGGHCKAWGGINTEQVFKFWFYFCPCQPEHWQLCMLQGLALYGHNHYSHYDESPGELALSWSVAGTRSSTAVPIPSSKPFKVISIHNDCSGFFLQLK